MLDKRDYIEVGILQKTFGTVGEFIVKLQQAEIEDIMEMESVFVEIDGGLVPFFIDKIVKKGKDKVLVKFNEVKTESRAIEFLHAKVFVNRASLIDIQEEIEFNNLIGFEIIEDNAGLIGNLKEIIEYPNNTVLSVWNGKTEILIPLNDDFIKEINVKKRFIQMILPEGLIDLYLNP